MDDTKVVREDVINVLDGDLLAADFLVCLTWSSAHSYRYDSVLRPFPSRYADQMQAQRTKDIVALKKDFKKIPKLAEIVSKENVDQRVWDLLHWILVKRQFHLEHTSSAEWARIVGEVGTQANKGFSPTQIFRVITSEEKKANFNRLASEYGSFHAFHGSKLENFFSILNNGLLGHLNKTSLFGEGTYFSSELSVAMNFSIVGSTWPKGSFHSPLNCVAMCAIVDHPSVGCSLPGRSTPSRGGLGNIPEKYYVVRNNDHIMLKYILVFESRTSPLLAINSWTKKHRRMTVFFLCFIFGVILALWLFDDILRYIYRLTRMKR